MKASQTRALLEGTLPATILVDLALLVQLFDHTPDIAFFVKDASGRYIAVNHSLVERHGLQSKAQMLGKRPSEVCPGDLGRIPSEQDAFVIRTGRPIIERLELQWFSPNKPVWCLTTKLPRRNSGGAIIGLIGISQDVRSPVAPGEIPDGVASAVNHLESHFGDPVTPSSLARIAGLSPARFARAVKRIFSLTPIQIISKTRLAAASRLLRETTRSVAEIANECGFYDHSAFTRAFRNATSATPSAYRAGMNPE